jgi:NADH-quinone oxidoreductase subunit M
VFFGPLDARWAGLGDARGVELVPLFTLTALILLFGLFPSLLIGLIEPGAEALALRLGQ